jgi:excisionase family DNA binding protein
VKASLEPHYTGRHLAELLSVNPETIRRAAARGDLRSVRVGPHRRYPDSAVREWLAGRNDSGGRE